MGRLGNEELASEAAQDAFVRAYFALPKLNKPASFFSWLLGIAGRVAKRIHRDQRRRRQVALADCEPAEMVSDHADSADTTVIQAVADLKVYVHEKDGDVLILQVPDRLRPADRPVRLHAGDTQRRQLVRTAGRSARQ